MEINLDKGEIMEISTGQKFFAVPFPPFMQEIMAKGGLINYVREKMTKSE